jgi:hypothetical protein
MARPRRPRNNPTGSVPEELLFKGYTWETMRERYFKNLGRFDEAHEAHQLRHLYSKRLWKECGISIDPIDV